MGLEIIHYDVQLSTRPTDTHAWRQNIQLDILTSSAMRAIEMALIKHPGAVVHVVQRRSVSNLIIDPDLKEHIHYG